jgi:hypothetical protein
MSQRFEPLEAVPFQANLNKFVNLDTLPPGMRVRALKLFVNLTGTKAGDTLDADLFATSIQNLRLNGPLPGLPGQEAYTFNRYKNGRTVMRGTDIPGAGVTFDINFVVELPFKDEHQPASDDGSIPTELLVGKALELKWDAATVFGGALVITGGTATVGADLVDETNVPQMQEIGFLAPTSKVIQIDPGVYKYMFLVKPDRSVITTAEVASIDLLSDGQPVYSGITHQQLCQLYNADSAWQSGTGAEVTPGASKFLPILSHTRLNSNLTKQVLIRNKGQFRLNGTLANYILVYCRALPKDLGAINDIARKIGVPAGSTAYVPARAKPSEGSADRVRSLGAMDVKTAAMHAYLPGKFRVAATPLSAAVKDAAPLAA